MVSRSVCVSCCGKIAVFDVADQKLGAFMLTWWLRRAFMASDAPVHILEAAMAMLVKPSAVKDVTLHQASSLQHALS